MAATNHEEPCLVSSLAHPPSQLHQQAVGIILHKHTYSSILSIAARIWEGPGCFFFSVGFPVVHLLRIRFFSFVS